MSKLEDEAKRKTRPIRASIKPRDPGTSFTYRDQILVLVANLGPPLHLPYDQCLSSTVLIWTQRCQVYPCRWAPNYLPRTGPGSQQASSYIG